MKYFIAFLFLVPFVSFSQEVTLSVDTIGNSPRIEFNGPLGNILLGKQAGNSQNTGSNNVYIGLQSGTNSTLGGRNVFLGSTAGFKNVGGSFNTNIGYRAGKDNIGGSRNVHIGDSAGYLDEQGNNNVKVGYFSGGNSIGNNNVFLGYEAGNDVIGSNQLIIANSNISTPLIHGFFDTPLLRINGDLEVTGDFDYTGTIDVSQISGLLGTGQSSFLPVVMDNTAQIEITGVSSAATDVVFTNTIGLVIDTFTIPGATCDEVNTGLNAEFPVTFETDDPTLLSDLNDWFASPIATSFSVVVQDVAGSETNRIAGYEYIPGSTGPGTDGRTSYTLVHSFPPDNTQNLELIGDFGSELSFNPNTDKIVEITSITHPNFCPAVEIDTVNKVVILEMTYNEGFGLYDWIQDFLVGIFDDRTMIIQDSNDGLTGTSQENFYEVVPFQYEIVYGVGLDTKLKARLKLKYACSEVIL